MLAARNGRRYIRYFKTYLDVRRRCLHLGTSLDTSPGVEVYDRAARHVALTAGQRTRIANSRATCGAGLSQVAFSVGAE